MSLFDFLKPKPKTNKELQAELKALCEKIVTMQGYWPSDMDRYERLKAELYKRGEEPEAWLEPNKADPE